MAPGLYLHLTEAHAHEHKHEALDHEHRHVHKDCDHRGCRDRQRWRALAPARSSRTPHGMEQAL
jgi:hypothetical protein